LAVFQEHVLTGRVCCQTREERKIDAIMKAFERMEKLAEKKREAQTRQARQKSSDKVEDNETPARKENPVERTRRRR